MTVIDRLRAALPGPADPGDPADRGNRTEHVAPHARARSAWRRGAAAGLVTGIASLLLVLVPTVIAWLIEPLATGTAWDAVGTGAALWLLTAGAHLMTGQVTLSLVPLLGLGLLVVVARLGAREAMVDVSTDGEHWCGLLPRSLVAALVAWWSTYAVVVAAAVALTTLGPFRVVVLSLLVPAVLVPVAGMGLALRSVVLDDPEVVGPRLGLARVPDAVRRGVRAGLWGAAALLGVGLVVVLALVALAWGEVSTISEQVGAAAFGEVVLLIAQVMALPNLALWAVSFVAGPGFQVVDGSSVTWAGAESGLLPMVPVLAALPQPGPFAWFAAVSSLGVVVVGGLVARRALAEVARLSRLRTKLAVAASACLTTALALGALDVLAGGSVGQFRLSSVGVPAGWLVLALLAELLLGAVVVVMRDAWRLRR
ncbi:MAG: hypothetical protein K0R30_2410 [Ornithinibacter sp.]|nr:hypothetical protein [Ornithinibacter sp.]